MDYPEEWNELPKHERRKLIKKLKKQKQEKQALISKLRNIIAVIAMAGLGIFAYRLAVQKTHEEVALDQEVKEASLEGKVEEFKIEGANHIGVGQSVSYKTNPPTSGPHYAQPANWKFYENELKDEQVVHNLEHGGIWITYKDANQETINKLKAIAKKNSNRVIVTRRANNDDAIVVASWGRMMRLDQIDEALIQKYIDTYLNQSPEHLAR